LLHKLRETRAFVGFSRWLPEDGKNLEARKDFIKLGRSISWLPAMVVRGEGVFFEFSERRLKEWASQKESDCKSKLSSCKDFNRTNVSERTEAKGPLHPKFVLIHTFAHLVINPIQL
jgi:hypothetical protein